MIDERRQQEYLDEANAMAQAERVGRIKAETALSQFSGYGVAKDNNLIQFQQDLKDDLNQMFHFLSGHELKVNPDDNSEEWVDPKDDRMKILSPYGVKQIMTYVSLYLGRNNLLANYESQQIIQKVHDFGIEVADLIFNSYEYFFYYPSPEQLYEIYLPLVGKQKMNISDAELYERCIAWSHEELKIKFRHYPMIVKGIVDIVHAAFSRAKDGRENTSSRKSATVIENINANNPLYQPRPGGPVNRLLGR